MSDTATLSRLFSGIEADLEVVDQTFQEHATSGLEILNSAAAHALSSPGKRVRTALTLLSGKLIEYRFEKLLPLSVAFEMVHLATLVHDDILDDADTRRGIPTINARYGNNVAILLGDYLFAKTAGLIADVEDFRIDHLFSETVASVCEGTIIELLSTRKLDLSVEAYLERISRKTACLMAACCKGGAIVGGGSDAQVALMEQYGLNLGIAFQIIDDVLDYAGTEALIGKPAGNDLRQGLVTLPLIYALKHEHNGRWERVEAVLRDPAPHPRDVGEIVQWVSDGPAVTEALAFARHYASRARAMLSEFASSPDRLVLEELVDFVIARSR
ncbi:MAG TPA: polyprenyl synthetase family protein [Ktedonobacterales bacterium]|nr:polyprenyl synthetase family protein [Ktedonobacterales bacterium]